MRFRKRLRYVYYRAVRGHGKPREIALGVAIGMAIGLTPMLGHTVIALAVAALTGQSKLGAVVGVWFNNPVTMPFTFCASYVIGAWLLHYPLVPPGGFAHAFRHLSAFTSEVYLPLWVGSLVLAVPVGAAVYWLTYQAVVAYRLKVKNRRANRLYRWHWSEKSGWHRLNEAQAKQADDD